MAPEEDKALVAEAHLIQEEVAAHHEFINLDQPHPEELSQEPTPVLPMTASAEAAPAVESETPAPVTAPAPRPSLAPVAPDKPKRKSPFAAFTNLFRKKKKVAAPAVVEQKPEAVEAPTPEAESSEDTPKA